MNEKFAIQIIKNNYPENLTVFREALDLALQALEKQIPKKPKIENWEPARCPSCDEELSESAGDGYYNHFYNLEFCKCGQKLEWE